MPSPHRTQLNAKATAVASSLGDTSLINAYRRRLIDAMGTIYCNGAKAFDTAVLLGMGPPYTIYYTWVADYPSTTFKVQYSSAVSQTAITEMAAGTCVSERTIAWSDELLTGIILAGWTGDIDFAAISTELTTAQKQLMPDAEGVPVIGYGILPVYNVRHHARQPHFSFSVTAFSLLILDDLSAASSTGSRSPSCLATIPSS
jgi:hypothetical protein